MARWDPLHVIRRVKLCLHAKFLGCSFFSLAKVPFFDYRCECGHVDMLMIHLVILILNIYGFVGLTSTGPV